MNFFPPPLASARQHYFLLMIFFLVRSLWSKRRYMHTSDAKQVKIPASGQLIASILAVDCGLALGTRSSRS